MTPFKRVMGEKRRLLWPLIIVLVANIAVLALVVYPLKQKVAVGEQEADAAAMALMGAKRDYANARALVTGKGQADAELTKFYGDILPPDLSGARRITYLPLEQLAAQSNLRLLRQTSEPSEIRDSDLRRFSQMAVLTGEYRDIRRFIHRLETAPEFIIIENVVLSQNENQTQSSRLTVTLDIATYYRAGADGN